MVTKVWKSPSIYNIQVDLPQNPLRSLNVYVIVTPTKNLIIDTGFNRIECREALWSGIRSLGLDLSKTSVFLTHLHSDHTGLAGDFVIQGCPIYMGRIDYEYLRLFDITPNIAVWNGVPCSLEDYLASLDKVRVLSVKAAFPAHRHGESDVYQRINALQNHHKERLEEIRQAVEDHPGSTVYQIAGMVTWAARGLGWEQFPPHQKWFVMGETLAHLRYLSDHGLVSRTENENIFLCFVSKAKCL